MIKAKIDLEISEKEDLRKVLQVIVKYIYNAEYEQNITITENSKSFKVRMEITGDDLKKV